MLSPPRRPSPTSPPRTLSRPPTAAPRATASEYKTDHNYLRTWADHELLPRTFQAVANQTAKNGYRADLRSAAVERVSAIKRTNKPVKPEPEQKLRGNKAKKAAAAAEEN